RDDLVTGVQTCALPIFETLVVSAQFAEGHATEILARRESLADDLAHDLVRLAERHAALRQVIGEIRGRKHATLGRPPHRLTVERSEERRGGKGGRAEVT